MSRNKSIHPPTNKDIYALKQRFIEFNNSLPDYFDRDIRKDILICHTNLFFERMDLVSRIKSYRQYQYARYSLLQKYEDKNDFPQFHLKI